VKDEQWKAVSAAYDVRTMVASEIEKVVLHAKYAIVIRYKLFRLCLQWI